MPISRMTSEAWRFDISDHEEQAKQQIDATEEHIVGMHASLMNQNDDGDPIAELFKDGWQHQRAITRRVARDYKERELPSQARADEAVEKGRVRYRRRVHLADSVKNKIKWSEYENAPDPRHQENDFPESQGKHLLKPRP